MDSLTRTITSEVGKQHLSRIEVARKAYLNNRNTYLRLIAEAKRDQARLYLLEDLEESQNNYIREVGNLITFQSDLMKTAGQEATNLASRTKLIILIVIGVGFIISIILAYFIIRSIVKPINEAVAIADSVSFGEMNVKIDASRKDEIGKLLTALSNMAASIRNMITEVNTLSEAAINGKLDKRADKSKYKGEYSNLISGINDTLDAVINPLNVTAEYVDRISKGDIPPKITDNYNGDFNEIKNNLNQCIDAVNLLVTDSKSLAEAAVNGELSTRADASRHHGDFKAIVIGINSTLDSVLFPINEAADVLKQMAEGNLSIKVKGDYKGEHALIKNALNTTVDMLPFKDTFIVLNAVAQGDLTKKMEGDYKGDALQLKEAMNSTIDSLNEILAQVSVTVDEVTRGAMQVSDASTALSQGATEQAASLEEITSSMSEIGSQTKTNAENANQANILTFDAKEAAEKGNREMEQLNKAMAEISESSRNISKIIKVIDEIAFQTNLLALNAAVEAARAGRHGKGFAVVAEEVRNLAARSASAAKETSELIENSIKTVENGSMLAIRTGEALEDIKNGSIKAADIVGEIATSSNEQAQGISQINEGLTQIDKVTQTNTASAEESASASEELSGQAAQLKSMLSKFKLDDDAVSNSLENFDTSHRSRLLNSRPNGKAKRSLPEHRLTEDDYSYQEDINPSDIIKLDEDDFGRY